MRSSGLFCRNPVDVENSRYTVFATLIKCTFQCGGGLLHACTVGALPMAGSMPHQGGGGLALELSFRRAARHLEVGCQVSILCLLSCLAPPHHMLSHTLPFFQLPCEIYLCLPISGLGLPSIRTLAEARDHQKALHPLPALALSGPGPGPQQSSQRPRDSSVV